MAVEIKMPKLSDTMTEGTLVSWLLKPGDAVKPGDSLGEVETDKATMPIELFANGTVAVLDLKEGQTVKVGARIAVIAEPGEDWQKLGQAGNGAAAASPSSPPQPASASAGKVTAPAANTGTAPATPPAARAEGDRVKVSPLAKKVAEHAGVDLSSLTGSGPNGRIVKADVEAAISAPRVAAAAAQLPAPAAADVEVKLTGLRKKIAERLQLSKQTIPHFYVEMEVDCAALVAFREQLKSALPDVKVTFNDLVIKACALTLRKMPEVNSSWAGDKILQRGSVDVGFGVAIDGGLVVPVVRRADQLSLSAIGKSARELIDKAKSRKLTPDEMTGSTFTISNMGMMGVTRFNAIVNPPESAILAVGAIREEPVARGGKIEVGQRMSLTLSADHRVIDGSAAAGFLGEVRRLLQEPLALVV